MMRKLSLLLLTYLIVPVSPLSAAVITFDQLAHSEGTPAEVNPLNINGFHFENSIGTQKGLGVWATGSPYSSDPDGATLFNDEASTTTTVTKIGGGTFEFNSIDLADVFNNGGGGDVRFEFTDNFGTTIQVVTVDDLPGAETFTFNLTGLTSFSYTPLTTEGPWIQIDNVVVNASTVPEPSTIALLGIGALCGASSAFRRRQHNPAAA